MVSMQERSKDRTTTQKKGEAIATTWLHIKAPVDFVERIDRWREHYKVEHDMVVTPSRPAVVRWIVYNFLLKDEQRTVKKRKHR